MDHSQFVWDFGVRILDFPAETIAAISTPPGLGGIAVLRLSGPESWKIASEISSFKFQASSFLPNSAHHTQIIENGMPIDDVVITLFKAPRSYTGEDVVEISCHGGRYAADKILNLLLLQGARPARPGEFTERAFLNNKLDLAQAEAVAGLIHARTERAGRAAVRQLAGGLSDKIRAMRSKILDLLALLEAELDFVEEDIEFQTRSDREAQILSVQSDCHRLLETFKRGRLVREGLRVAIIGAPNAGKSTLLNALVGEERAIVSDIPGTTRDVVEARLLLNGIEVILQDTAGIREAEGQIESIGIERSHQAAELADLILMVIDDSNPVYLHPLAIAPGPGGLILVRNKTDLRNGRHPELRLPEEFRDLPEFDISARTGAGIPALVEAIGTTVSAEELGNTEIVVTEARHAEALSRTVDSLESARTQLANTTLMATDLREAINALGEITGETIGEEILDRIFSKFCIGK